VGKYLGLHILPRIILNIICDLLKKKQGGIENTSYRKKQPKVRCHIGEQVAKVTGAIDLSASFLVDPMSKLSLLP